MCGESGWEVFLSSGEKLVRNCTTLVLCFVIVAGAEAGADDVCGRRVADRDRRRVVHRSDVRQRRGPMNEQAEDRERE